MLKVICCGIPRSGSTWLYNTARLLARKKYASIRAGWYKNIDVTPDVDVLVAKIHEKEPGWADGIVLLSHRDLRDAAISCRAMGWADNDDDLLYQADHIRRLHDAWLPFAKLDLAYENIKKNPLVEIKKVSNALEIDISVDQLNIVLEEISQLNKHVDDHQFNPINLLHPQHINDGRPGRWRDQMSMDIARKITDAHRDWLAKYSYDTLDDV